MIRDRDATYTSPDRLHAGRGQFLPGLIATAFPIGLLAWLARDGGGHIALAGLAVAVLGNIFWAIGCFAPDGLPARMLRWAAIACSAAVTTGMVIWATLQVTDLDW